MKKLIAALIWFLSIPAFLVGLLESIAVQLATKRWHLWGFIPCSAGLWPLGLYCWRKELSPRYLSILLKLFSYPCFIFGTALFLEGLWVFSAILLLIRFLFWLDGYFRLGDSLIDENGQEPIKIFHHPFDRICVFYIAVIFVVFAINKERLIEFGEPSDHYYHMAVAQKILERGHIPIWDDWEFAPMGRPHLYPPLLHLSIAFFSGEPDRVVEGFSTIQMLLYPIALFSYWLLFRTLLPPWHAYMSLIVLSMEFMFGMGALIGLPATIANVLWAFIILALLKRKTYTGTILLALAYYTHTGMPLLISLSLLIYGVWRREHALRALLIVVGAFLLSIPWTLRYFVFSNWMHAGGAPGFSFASIMARLFWLQIINPIFIVMAVWGWFRLGHAAVFKSQVLGFLPMLMQYGGRFFMHGAPFLSPFIAVHFKRFLTGTITRRRAIGFLLLTLIPLPCVNLMGPGDTLQIRPFPGITASHFSIYFMLNRSWKDQSELENLVDEIRNNTSQNDIIHLPDEGMYHFGDYLTVLTGRRTDTGGWGEVHSVEMWEQIIESRQSIHDGVFVSRNKNSIPDGRRIKKLGSFYLGYPPCESDSDNP